MSWSKYIGEDGETGRGLASFEIKYAAGANDKTPPEGDWKDNISEVSLTKGAYLWTKYTPIYDNGDRGDPSYGVSY
jgi:hypothetical protein